MKKLINLSCCFFLFRLTILCQPIVPHGLILSDHYEWGVYITDAKGNKDTLIFGSHPLAKANTLIGEIGERQERILDTSSLDFVIDKSPGLKTKRAFGEFLTKLSFHTNGFFMDSIFYLNQTVAGGFEGYAPVFFSGKAIDFPLTITVRQIYQDSFWRQRLNLWRLYVGEYRNTEVFVQFEEDSFRTKDNTITVQRSDIKFRPDGTMAFYILFFIFVTANRDFLIDEITIFPNPGNNVIHVQNKGNSVFESYTIYDYGGKLMIFDKKIPSEINIANLPAGIYFLVFKTKVGIRDIKKFVVIR